MIHLPDFTEIDQFKEEICCTLAEYGARMEELRTEMEELTLSAENIEKVQNVFACLHISYMLSYIYIYISYMYLYIYIYVSYMYL